MFKSLHEKKDTVATWGTVGTPWSNRPYFCATLFASCSLSASSKNSLLHKNRIKNLSKAQYQLCCSSVGRSSTRKMFQHNFNVMLPLAFGTLGPFHIMSDRSLASSSSSSDSSSSWCRLFYPKGSGQKTDCISYPSCLSQTWSEMHIKHRCILIDMDCLHRYLRRRCASIDQINFIAVSGFHMGYNSLDPHYAISITQGTLSCTLFCFKCVLTHSNHNAVVIWWMANWESWTEGKGVKGRRAGLCGGKQNKTK